MLSSFGRYFCPQLHRPPPFWGHLALQKHPPVEFCSEAQTNMLSPPFMPSCRVPLPRKPFLPLFELQNLLSPVQSFWKQGYGMKRRRCKYIRNSFPASRTLCRRCSRPPPTPRLSGAVGDGRAGVLVPGPVLLLTPAELFQNMDARVPPPGTVIQVGPHGTQNLCFRKGSWQFCRAVSYGTHLAVSHRPHSAARHPSIQDRILSLCRESRRVTQRRPKAPLPSLKAGEPAAARLHLGVFARGRGPAPMWGGGRPPGRKKTGSQGARPTEHAAQTQLGETRVTRV